MSNHDQARSTGAIIATLASVQERLATLVTAWEREDLDTTHITSTAGVSANVAIANAIFCIEEQEQCVTEERKSRLKQMKLNSTQHFVLRSYFNETPAYDAHPSTLRSLVAKELLEWTDGEEPLRITSAGRLCIDPTGGEE